MSNLTTEAIIEAVKEGTKQGTRALKEEEDVIINAAKRDGHRGPTSTHRYYETADPKHWKYKDAQEAERKKAEALAAPLTEETVIASASRDPGITSEGQTVESIDEFHSPEARWNRLALEKAEAKKTKKKTASEDELESEIISAATRR